MRVSHTNYGLSLWLQKCDCRCFWTYSFQIGEVWWMICDSYRGIVLTCGIKIADSRKLWLLVWTLLRQANNYSYSSHPDFSEVQTLPTPSCWGGNPRIKGVKSLDSPSSSPAPSTKEDEQATGDEQASLHVLSSCADSWTPQVRAKWWHHTSKF